MRRLAFDLTPAELDALELAADGLTVVESAAALYKSPETIKSQLLRIRLKLGARNTTHAVVLALRLGLIRLPGVDPLKDAA